MLNSILIADDATTARMIIKKCLQIVGYGDAEFLEVANGREALEIAKKQHIDLLLTDINMPVMDGVELLRRIKTSPKLTGIPIIVITSTSNTDFEAKIIAVGALAVLNKPVNPSLLAEALEVFSGDEDNEESDWG